MKKRLTALLLICCLLFEVAPVIAGAADGQKVTANAVTVTAGKTATVTLKAENFSNIAALDVYVFYDAQVFSVSTTSNGSMLSSAQSSVNTAEAGTIKLSTMALNGINGTGTLLTVNFTTNANCTPGTYPITIAIGRAYNGNLQEAAIGSINGSITVNKPEETETFSLYSYPDKTTLQKGDVLSCRIASASSSRAFVSGEFLVEYDHEVFAFESVALESALTKEGAVYSVNSSTLGQVRIAYASVDPVKSFYLFTVKLTVIANKTGTTTINAQASNMYRENLSMYLPGSTSKNLTLQKLPETVDYPNAFFKTNRLVVGNQSNSVFCLEASAGVAAADFTLTYDPALLCCVSVTGADGLSEKGGMVVVNDNFGDGTIRFSYINMDAFSAEDLPLVQIVWEPLQSSRTHYELTSDAEGVVDAQQNAITLEYVKDTDCIYVATIIEPTCKEEGQITYLCACGDSFQESTPVNPEKHTYSGDCDTTCNLCGESRNVESTHTFDGAEDTDCNNCGQIRQLTNIVISAIPTKTEYKVNQDSLDVTGGKIQLVYNDGTSGIIDMTANMVSGFENTVVGEQTLRVTYGGKETSFAVKIVSTNANATLNVYLANVRLQELMKMGFYFTMNTNETVLETGAIVWTAEEYAKETAFDIHFTQGTKYLATTHTNPNGSHYYSVETNGIPAQEIDTKLYIAPYVKTENGYAYGAIKSNSILNVCKYQYQNDTDEVKAMIADVLNYATAARNYFVAKGELEAPAEAFNAILSKDDKVLAWSEELYAPRAAVDETTSSYAPTAYQIYVYIQDALKIEFVFADNSVTGMMYWKGTDYTENDVHDGTTKTGEATISVQGRYVVGAIEGINAFNIYEDYYVRGYNANGDLSKTYTTSIAAYLTYMIQSNSNPADAEAEALVELCKAMMIYGKNAMENDSVNKG